MFASEALEMTIGLVLIFLLFSMLLTALVEVIEAFVKTRAADLERAIKMMLHDPDGVSNRATEIFYNHPLVFALFNGEYKTSRKIWFLGRDKGGDLPSYIPRDIFSAVILDLESAGAAGGGAAGVVESYRRLYGGDVAMLKANLESWYDGVMDRAAGWYKRRTQKLLFCLGLILAVALNINPIAIGQYLSATPDARKQMVEIADDALGAGPPGATDDERSRRVHKAVRGVGLPIGWSQFAISRSFPGNDSRSIQSWLVALLIAVSGWLMTAIAATLGAPFWFDVLNKLMVIRATVKPKEKSRDEASEDRSRADRRTEVAVVGSGGRAAGGIAPGSAATDAVDTPHGEQADGCLDGYDVSDEQVTNDIELPPATGGITGRD